MALSTTMMNGSNITMSAPITGNAVCFRDPDHYFYSNGPEAFCEELVWSTEYFNIISSIPIALLGFYQLTWENHNSSTLRFISGLLILCSISSFLNHLYNIRAYLLLENFTMNCVQYIVLSIMMEKFGKNVQILLNKSGVYKSKTLSTTQSRILSGINWTFCTFCIYFLLYRDLNGCEWGTVVYKIGYLLPICIEMLFVALVWFLDTQYRVRIGTICHSFDAAGHAYWYFRGGASMVFIGAFIWILLQSTCLEGSGIEYIPAHALWHILFVYGYSLINQYYIFLVNDLNKNRMVLSSRMKNTNKLFDILFPYFMSYKGIYQEETERILNDIDPNQSQSPTLKLVDDTTSVSVSKTKEVPPDLRETIVTKNATRKQRRLQKKLAKRQNQNKRRPENYDEFDVTGYGLNFASQPQQTQTQQPEIEKVELQMVDNGIQEEEAKDPEI